MLDRHIKTIIVEKLYLYKNMDSEIEKLKKDIEFDAANSKDVNSYIKSKNKVSRAVENQAMRKIEKEKQIAEYEMWKLVIQEAEIKLKEKDKEKSNFLNYKYFCRYNVTKVCGLMLFSRTTHDRVNDDVLNFVGMIAIKQGLMAL